MLREAKYELLVVADRLVVCPCRSLGVGEDQKRGGGLGVELQCITRGNDRVIVAADPVELVGKLHPRLESLRKQLAGSTVVVDRLAPSSHRLQKLCAPEMRIGIARIVEQGGIE